MEVTVPYPWLQKSWLQLFSDLQSSSYPVRNKNSIQKVIYRIHNTSDDALFQEVDLLAQSFSVLHEYMLLFRVPVQRHVHLKVFQVTSPTN